jgi:hypothetical protein
MNNISARQKLMSVMSAFLPTYWVVNGDGTMTQRGGSHDSYQGLTNMDGRPIQHRPTTHGADHGATRGPHFGAPPARKSSGWQAFLVENHGSGKRPHELAVIWKALPAEARRQYAERAKERDEWVASGSFITSPRFDGPRYRTPAPIAPALAPVAPVPTPAPAPAPVTPVASAVPTIRSFRETLLTLKGESTPTDCKEDECSLCLTNCKTVALVPCGHMCYCVACCRDSQISETCPMCRQTATSAMQVFR